MGSSCAGSPARTAVVLAVLGAACGAEPPVEPPPPPPVPVALMLTASDTLRVAGTTATFAAVAVDSAGAPVPGIVIGWSVRDTARGWITNEGVFTAGPDSGLTWVRARALKPPLAESLPVRVVTAGTVRWTWPADPGLAFPNSGAPALGLDGTVYVLEQTGHFPDWLATLVALSPAGTVRWRRQLQHVWDNYPVVTPTGDVLLVSEQIRLFGPDGSLRWETVTDAVDAGYNAGAVTGDLVIAAYGQHVGALRLVDGAIVWQSPYYPLSDFLEPPTIVGSRVTYAKKVVDTLFVFRLSDGAVLKTFEDPDTGSSWPHFGRGAVPVGDRFYLPTLDQLAAFDTAGPLLWLTDGRSHGMSEPAVGPDGVLYVQSGRWGLQAINPDGTTRWYRRHAMPLYGWSEAPRWPSYGGPTLAAGGIIYAAGSGAFHAYDVSGTPLWSYMAGTMEAWESFLGAPAVAPDGTVYTFTNTHVYAFYGPSPPEPNSPWPMWRHDARRTGWAR